MNVLNDNHGLWHLPTAPGCAFRLVNTGRLTSFDGCRYRLGGYCCWHIVKAGSGTVRAGRREFQAGPGDMFSLVEEREIEYFDDPTSPWEFYYLHIDGPGAGALTRAAGFDPARPWQRPRRPEAVLGSFRRLYQMAEHPGEHSPVEFSVAVLRLADLLDTAPAASVRTPEELVRQARRMAAEGGYGGMNVNEIARALRVDRGTLHRAFTAVAAISPGEYLRREKLRRAAALLRERPELTAGEIAAICGFANPKYFIRAFARAYGATPGRWRE